MNNTLRALVDLRDKQIQKARIQFGNRVKAIERMADRSNGQQSDVVERWFDVFQTLEKTLDSDIKRLVKDEEIFEEMSQIKGLGPILSAKILAMVDIERANTVSGLWKYAGYGVGNYWQDEDGKIKAPQVGFVWDKDQGCKVKVQPEPQPDWMLVQLRDRPVEGFLLAYNKRLKITVRLVGESFIKSNSPYRLIYDNAKVRYDGRDWTPLHIHNAALRKMCKIFLSHLWERWRIMRGLPTRMAYVHEELGHETVYYPHEFGWGGEVEPEV